MRHETLKVAPSLTLHLDAEAFTVADVAVTTLRDTDEAPLAEVRLSVEVDAVTWHRLERSAAFHLDTAHRGPSMVERFEPASPIRIEATLGAAETAETLSARTTDKTVGEGRSDDPVDIHQRVGIAEPVTHHAVLAERHGDENAARIVRGSTFTFPTTPSRSLNSWLGPNGNVSSSSAIT